MIRFNQDYCAPMQAAELKNRSGSGNLLREWVRTGVVIPAYRVHGKGQRAEYDDASLLAAVVARLMSGLHVVISHYLTAFEELHTQLRTRGRSEWAELVLAMSPGNAQLLPAQEQQLGVSADQGFAVIVVALKPVCEGLFAIPVGTQMMMDLLAPSRGEADA